METIDAVTEQQLAAVEAEVRRLADLEAIYRLRLSYYAHVNESRFDELPALFAPEARVDFGNELGSHKGREALATALAGLAPDLFTKVLSHGHVADLAGDTAEGHLFIEGRLIVDGESFITMGKVSDRYVRQDGRWLIAGTDTLYYYATPLDVGWAVEDNLRPFTSP